jgi:hypothetical protein
VRLSRTLQKARLNRKNLEAGRVSALQRKNLQAGEASALKRKTPQDWTDVRLYGVIS